MSSTPELPIARVGAVLGGKLRLERVIGEGAMGIVYEATDLSLARRVAVKVILPAMVGDTKQRLRFAREARAAAALVSEHAVRVLDVSGEAEEPYLVMEYLEGRTLDAVVHGDGRPPAHVAVGWILEALVAIAEAHGRGLVHRDIKPANLFLADRVGSEPIVKVLDFGVVKDLDPTATRLTKTGASMGSPAYMAPEQVRALPDVDTRADIWAVGVTLYELLTGKLPFLATTLPDLLKAICQRNPEPLRAGRPDIPEPLEAIVKRCLAKDRRARYATAAELAKALDAALVGEAATFLAEPQTRREAPMTMPMASPLRLAATEDWTQAAPPPASPAHSPGPTRALAPAHSPGPTRALAPAHSPAAAPAPAPAHAHAHAHAPAPAPMRAAYGSVPSSPTPPPPPPISSRRDVHSRPRPRPQSQSRALIFVIAFIVVLVVGGLALVALFVLAPPLPR